ncbi:MAG: efflux transporter periplasmic adaptor subunit, partial [Acidobacteria bacterium]|nr:efflux transporter periplasmic adaptor subunit [Acidobacteriota bacterium]
MKIKWRSLLWVIGIIALSAGIFLALRPRPIEIEAATIGRGGLRTTIPAEGRTRIHDRFVIAAPVTGRLRRIDLHRG